ncbi:unnamed protein product [Thelazia callipaeda]|uniref:NR LBD domain-containing protein n=1 Tax=Thelazia callipaeda TaxID=103827 RepID=A0A0N5CSF2_THECL|nr:unnamed protein product [Thelazia callipaeda]
MLASNKRTEANIAEMLGATEEQIVRGMDGKKGEKIKLDLPKKFLFAQNNADSVESCGKCLDYAQMGEQATEPSSDYPRVRTMWHSLNQRSGNKQIYDDPILITYDLFHNFNTDLIRWETLLQMFPPVNNTELLEYMEFVAKMAYLQQLILKRNSLIQRSRQGLIDLDEFPDEVRNDKIFDEYARYLKDLMHLQHLSLVPKKSARHSEQQADNCLHLQYHFHQLSNFMPLPRECLLMQCQNEINSAIKAAYEGSCEKHPNDARNAPIHALPLLQLNNSTEAAMES